ncbi:hypothetical protein IC006_0109 [Sulfuracidifex tepidarius]|uniref:Uncharacterized protein n=1 Tax=Sulfuracidifex tepidarius TaxID=1294262 RepID=A0A510DRR6_9CREN|nr:hypothetical protein IC006_0109 [Sulfuracidifex tepidarius]
MLKIADDNSLHVILVTSHMVPYKDTRYSLNLSVKYSLIYLF